MWASSAQLDWLGAQEIQQNVEAGNLERVTVRADGPDTPLSDAQGSLLHEQSDDSLSQAGCEGSALGTAPALEDPSASGSIAVDGAAAALSGQVVHEQPAGPAARGAEPPEPSQARDGLPAADLEPPGPSTPAAAPGSRGGPAGREPPPVGRRPEQAPERLELRDAALSDPATPGAAAALLRGVPPAGGSPLGGRQQAAELERVRAQAAAAGKGFMDGLARNVGLAGDAEGLGFEADGGGTGAGQPPGLGQQTEDPAGGSGGSVNSLIDDIAAGRAAPPAAPVQAAAPAHPIGEREAGGATAAQPGASGGVRVVTSSQVWAWILLCVCATNLYLCNNPVRRVRE